MKAKQLPTALLNTYKIINKIDDNSWDSVQYELLNFKKLAGNAGYSFVEALKVCSETAGLLDAKKISFLIKPGFATNAKLYNADLAAEVISSGVITTDKFQGPLLSKGGEFNGTLRDYVMRQDLPQVLNALNQSLLISLMKVKQLPTALLDTYKIINKIDDNCWDSVQYELLNFKKLASNAGYSFVEALKSCSEIAGLLDAKKISFLIKPGFVGKDLYNADLAAEVISSGVVTTDKFHGPLLKKGGEFNGTLRDYVIGQDLPQVLNALNQPLVDTQKIINNINDNSELITNTPSIINPVQVFSKNSKVEVKDFDHGFQDAYLGAILNGGGNSCIYALKSEPNKIIRISQASGYHDSISMVMDVNDWLKNKLAYKNVCNLVAFKNKYPELPVAQIDDVFFIRAQKVISPYKFGNKDSVDSIKGNTDFYYMATIMEKLVDEHPDLNSDAVINAQAVFKKLNIGIEDFKSRNVVKKICKELVENNYTSYEVPVFIDYDEWSVPTIGESDSVAFA